MVFAETLRGSGEFPRHSGRPRRAAKLHFHPGPEGIGDLSRPEPTRPALRSEGRADDFSGGLDVTQGDWPPSGAARSGGLLERDALVERLRQAAQAALGGAGSLGAVSGEPGAGKTALVREVFTPTSALWGYCEPLSTPRPLGPFHDIAGQIWPDRVAGTPPPVAGLRERMLAWLSEAPTPLVIEDAHWIDEASADVLRFLARRIETTSGLLVITFRDELAADHPLRRVLGDLATARGIARVELPPLSDDAVAALVADSGIPAQDAVRLTRGNPFLVEQLLAAPVESVTASLRDAVAARLMRLDPETRTVVELLSVVPGRVPAALLADDWAHLDAAGRVGLVEIDGRWAQFRHELVRLAVEQEVKPGRARDLHADVLRRLSELDDVEPATIAYHARRAHDPERAFHSEVAAAQRAVELGSHREAVAHYGRAVAASGAYVPPVEQAELLLALSRQEHLVGHDRLATEAAHAAVELLSPDDDVIRYAAALRWLSRVTPVEAESHRLALAAVALLEPLGPSAELAAAYAYLAANRMIARALPAATGWARVAVDLAVKENDTESQVVALQALGVSLTLAGTDSECRVLREAVQLCLQTGMDFELGRAYANLVAAPGEARLYDVSHAAAEEAVAYFVAQDLDGHAGYARAWRARSLFDQGRWSEAATLTDELLDGCFHPTANTAQNAHYVRGRLRARRGEDGAWDDLDRAKELADVSGSLQRLWPTAAARAEARWLAGQPDDGTDGLRAAYELAIALSNSWAVGELGFWMWRHGLLEGLPDVAAAPYRLQVAGHAEAAARAWLEIGCPYEAADARTDADDEDAVRAGLELLTELGATSARKRAVRRLRQLGVRSIPRGPRETTAADPDGLTAREREVFCWLEHGSTDAEIARRLHLSVKTVGHHVSAVLRKTGSRSRRELLTRAS